MHEPRTILAAIDHLHEQVGHLYELSESELPAADWTRLSRSHHDVAKLLGLLQIAAEHFGVCCTPLIEVGTRWESLWKGGSEPADAIRRLRELMPAEWLVAKLQATTGRLRVIVLEKLVRAPVPADQELRRVAGALRELADEGWAREDEVGLLGQHAITAVNVGRLAVESLNPLREAIELSARGGNSQAVGLAVLEWMRSAGFKIFDKPGPRFLRSVAEGFEELAEQSWPPAPKSELAFGPENTVTLDGAKHPLTERQYEVLRSLHAAEGGWVSGTKLKEFKDGYEEPYRIIAKMPQPIRALIESKRGTGFCLRAL